MTTPPAPGRAEGLVPYKLPVRAVNLGGSKIRIEDADGDTFAYVYYCNADYGKQIKDTLAVARAEAIVAAINRPAPAIVAEVGEARRWCVFPPHADKVVSEADYDTALRTLAEVRGERDGLARQLEGWKECGEQAQRDCDAATQRAEQAEALLANVHAQTAHNGTITNSLRDAIDAALPAPATNATGEP